MDAAAACCILTLCLRFSLCGPVALQYPTYNSQTDQQMAEEDFHYAYNLSFLLALIANLICGPLKGIASDG